MQDEDAPLHVPPHDVASLVHAGRPPTGAPTTRVQLPRLPGSAHDSQLPLQLVSQQNPSTQRPFAHSCAPVGHALAVALAFFGTQTPPLQKSPTTQSASRPHDVLQAVPPQT